MGLQLFEGFLQHPNVNSQHKLDREVKGIPCSLQNQH